jgi:hypothetical protein
MHDEATLDQHIEQVIGRRSRHSDVSDQRRTLHGPGTGREVEQHIERPTHCW